MRKITMKSSKSNENGGGDDSIKDRENSEEPESGLEDNNETDNDDDDNKQDQNDNEKEYSDEDDESPPTDTKSTKKSKKSKKSKSTSAANGKSAKGKSTAAAKRKKTQPKRIPPADEQEEYEVEKVVGKQTFSGKTHFLIRWKGYSAKDDSWEAEDTLHCADLIKEYVAAEKKQQAARKAAPPRRTQRVDYSEEDDGPEVDYINNVTGRGRKGGNKKKISSAKKVEEEYEVDKILKVNTGKKGEREFLVSWKGYPESQATWEPENNLNCRDLLDKFLEDNEDNEDDDEDVDEEPVAKKVKPTKTATPVKKKGKSKRKAGRH